MLSLQSINCTTQFGATSEFAEWTQSHCPCCQHRYLTLQVPVPTSEELHWSLISTWTLSHNCLRVAIQKILYLGSGIPITFMSIQFRDKELLQDQCQSSSLIHQHSTCIIKGHQIHQTGFSLNEAMLAVINHLLIFHVPQHSFQEDFIHDYAEHRRETSGLVMLQRWGKLDFRTFFFVAYKFKEIAKL